LQFPEQGLVYDYKLNDAGLTSADVDDGEDDDDADNKKEKVYFGFLALSKILLNMFIFLH